MGDFSFLMYTDVALIRPILKNEWGVIDRGMFLFTVDERDPSDEFLLYYMRRINECLDA